MDIDALSEHLQSIFAETQTKTAVSLGELKLRPSISSGYFVKYKGTSVCKHQSIPDIINAWTELRTETASDSINGWERVKDTTSLREYQTEYEELSATITELNGTFTVTVPRVNKNKEEFTDFECAELYLYIFLYENPSFNAEYTYILNTLVKNELRDITGIGPKTADRLINRGVTSWEEVKENVAIVSSQHKTTAKQEIQSKIDSNETLTDDDKLKELSSKAVVDNL